MNVKIKRIFNLNILLFILPLFIIGLANIMNRNKPTVSVYENRKLASLPQFSSEKLWSGQFTKELEDYYSDTFFFREKLVELSSSIKILRGISLGEGVSITVRTSQNEFVKVENASKGDNDESKESTVNIGSISVGQQGDTDKTDRNDAQDDTSNKESDVTAEIIKQYAVIGDSAMSIYSFNDETNNHFTNAVNTLRENIDSKVKMYNLVVPTRIEFIDSKKYKNISDSQKNSIDLIASRLSDSIIKVNAYETLKKNSQDYIYFRTDHHWTAKGAYAAYTAFMKCIGEEPIPLSNYEEGTVEGYLGSTYYGTMNKKLAEKPDTVYYYKPFIEHKFYAYDNGNQVNRAVIDMPMSREQNKYCIFLGGLQFYRGKIINSVANDKKILVIKDSYGTAFIPFLMPHYKEIHIIDPRSCDVNIPKFINNNKIQEVLVLTNIELTGLPSYADLISGMANIK